MISKKAFKANHLVLDKMVGFPRTFLPRNRERFFFILHPLPTANFKALFFIAVLGSQYVSYLLTCVVSRIVNISLRSVTLIRNDVPTLIRHNQWKSIVCIRTLGFTLVYFIGLGKKIMSWMYHYNILVFSLLKISSGPFLTIHPCTPTPGNHWSFYCLHSFAFSRISYGWNHIAYSLFRLASFTE